MNVNWRPLRFRVWKFLEGAVIFYKSLYLLFHSTKLGLTNLLTYWKRKPANTSIPFLPFKLPRPRCQDASSSVEPAWDQKPPTMAAWPTLNPTAKRDATNCQPARPYACTGLLVRCTALCLKMSAITRVRQIAWTEAACLLRESRGWRATDTQLISAYISNQVDALLPLYRLWLNGFTPIFVLGASRPGLKMSLC